MAASRELAHHAVHARTDDERVALGCEVDVGRTEVEGGRDRRADLVSRASFGVVDDRGGLFEPGEDDWSVLDFGQHRCLDDLVEPVVSPASVSASISGSMKAHGVSSSTA